MLNALCNPRKQGYQLLIAGTAYSSSATERRLGAPAGLWGVAEMPNRVSEYFASRALAEQIMSSFAMEPRVAAAHSDMAERYEQLAVEFDIHRPGGFRPSATETPEPSAS